MVRLSVRVLCVLGLTALAGCDVLGPVASVQGSYELASIGNEALPIAIRGGTLIVVAQRLELNEDGTALLTETTRSLTRGVQGPDVVRSFEGRWVRHLRLITVTTPRERTQYWIADDGRTIRSVARESFVADLDVPYQFVFVRP